jgi:hypothetical protein
MVKARTVQAARVGVPDQRSSLATCDKGLPIGAKRKRHYPSMPERHIARIACHWQADRLRCRGIPQPHFAIETSRRRDLAVRTEGQSATLMLK